MAFVLNSRKALREGCVMLEDSAYEICFFLWCVFYFVGTFPKNSVRGMYSVPHLVRQASLESSLIRFQMMVQRRENKAVGSKYHIG